MLYINPNTHEVEEVEDDRTAEREEALRLWNQAREWGSDPIHPDLINR